MNDELGTDNVFEPGADKIFVFGSNQAGIHGAGAAWYAYNECGAEWYKGMGKTGSSYAIPTKDVDIVSLPLSFIKDYVWMFIDYAKGHPNKEFFVTRIGCGLAGYKDEEIAPFFKGAPKNCKLPPGWRKLNDEA